ncbi:hypothetical protein TNCV_3173231 [Trichonephila clavipes]|nr:hypothetical protein TNCV_3173231 [Trichonephila clavipes]
MFLFMRYGFYLLQWLLCDVSPYSAPNFPTVLEARVPISQSESVSVVGCSPEDVIMPQGILPKYPISVLWPTFKGCNVQYDGRIGHFC